MDLSALEQDVLRRLGFNTSSVDATTKTRVDAFLNETQQEILSEPGMEVLLHDTITFASVASTPTYALPPVVARIRTIRDATNLLMLIPRDLGWYRTQYPDPTAITGISDVWVDLGYTAVLVQPSNASELFAISTAAGDTNTVYLEGYRTGGYPITLSATMTGLTAKSLGTAYTDLIEVTKFYVSAAAVGTITLREDSGTGTELARIPITQTHARYRRIALAPCPSSAVTYTLDIERDVPDLANAKDEPMLPLRFHRLLAVGARMREYEKQDQDRYALAAAEFQRGLKKLKFYLYSQAVGTPNLRGASVSHRASRLGAQFGVDHW